MKLIDVENVNGTVITAQVEKFGYNPIVRKHLMQYNDFSEKRTPLVRQKYIFIEIYFYISI